MSRVPRIRFKGFEEDWEQRKLGEIVKEVNRVDENSSAPVMMITANDGFIEQSERYSTDNAGKSLKKYILLKKWELAYNHGASKIRPFGSCFALTRAANIRIPFVYHCFLALEDNPEFLEHTLNGKNVENQLRKIVSSGARMDGLLNISFQEYTSIFIRCPIRKEQDKISILIKSIDHLLTLHQRKLEKLKIIKKSMLENLFPQNGEKTPKIRFSGFTEDWEQRKLGEIGNTYSGLSGKVKDDFGHGQASFITYMNVYSNPVSRCDMIEPIEIDNRQNEVEIGDVFFTTSSETPEEVGMTSVLAEKKGITYLNSFCFGFRPFEKIDKYYLAYMLRSKNTREKIILLAQGISRYNISKNKVMEISVELPSFDEQILIGKKFKLIDHLITLHQSKLEKLQKIKKSMLESMFV